MVDLFSSDNLWLFVGGVAATVATAALLDREAERYFAHKCRLGPLDDFGNHFLGTGELGAAIGLATLVYGLKYKKNHSIDAGEAHLEALVANLVLTSALKFSIRRQRPDGSDRYSFPSGHTSTMFTTAAIMTQFYGLAVGAPFIALATVTGVGRVSANRHRLSDVLFGGVLGYLVGMSFAKHHLLDSAASETSTAIKWHALPYWDAESAGLAMTANF